jgi:hypothetical protein
VVLDDDFRFRLLGVVSGVSGVEITRAVGEDEIAVVCWTMGTLGTGPVERRRRRVVGTVGGMTGVTCVGVALGEDDWIVGMPCVVVRVARLSVRAFRRTILCSGAGWLMKSLSSSSLSLASSMAGVSTGFGACD